MDGETTRNSKKEHSKKTKKTFILVLDNGDEIYRDDVVRDTDECFKVDKIDIDNIRVSKKYPYGNNGKYKNLVFYETEDNYVPLKIVLRDIEGYYGEYKGVNSMNFMLKNDTHGTLFWYF